MTKLLLCRPQYYAVSYEINPWMHLEVQPDPKKALDQWDDFNNLLKSLDVTIEYIEQVEGLPDMVFTANGGLVFENSFILSNFRFEQRQKEAPYFEKWFRDAGYEIIKLPEDCHFEGEGDALMFGGTLVAGFKYRTDIKSHNKIGEILKKEVISLELASPDFYHLDTCFCPLDDNSALYFPGAFDDYGKRALAGLVPELIEVGEEDAKNFCCNALALGRDIVMNRCTDELKTTLEDKGLTIHTLDFSEFIKAGGSAKCLVLKVR